MEIKVTKAILHILDNNSSTPIYSQKELHLEGGIDDFIVKHIKKTLLDDNAKQSVVKPSSAFFNLVNTLNDQGEFVRVSTDIAQRLYSIMKSNVNIPNADILAAVVSIDGQNYLAVIKFNYKEGFTHYVDCDEEGTNNQIILHKALFPSETQKNDESALINISEKTVYLVEKPYEINGEKLNYFSELFMECKTDLSSKESLKIVKKAAEEIGKKYYSDSFQTTANLKTVLFDAVESKEEINVKMVADKMFYDKPEIRDEYIEEVKKAGIKDKIQMNHQALDNKFSKQRIKTDNGIELSIPMELYKNKEAVQFINNPDGTISLIINKINKFISK